jgi:hypothetical protein
MIKKTTRKAQPGTYLLGHWLLRYPRWCGAPLRFQRHIALLRPHPYKCDPLWLAYIRGALIFEQAAAIAAEQLN